MQLQITLILNNIACVSFQGNCNFNPPFDIDNALLFYKQQLHILY